MSHFALGLFATLLAALAAAVAAGNLHVAPSGSMAQPCGNATTPACSLETGIEMAAPYTTLVLSSGVYRGAWHIAKPLRFQASQRGAVIFDGEARHRPLWFDNVPADLDGIVFQNGFGEHAGCLLVTVATARRMTTNISRCEFVNCTAVPATSRTHITGRIPGNLVGGAVAILYTSTSSTAHEITDSTFSRNYARGELAAGGAVVVSHDSRLRPAAKCRTLVLHTSLPDIVPYHGAWRASPTLTAGGEPVFLGPDAVPLRSATHAMALCHRLNSKPLHVKWGIFPFNGDDDADAGALERRACNAPIVSDDFRPGPDGISPSHVSKWHMGAGLLAESTTFQCEDAAEECDAFQTFLMPTTQLHRGGMFVRLPNRTFNARPIFKRFERPETFSTSDATEQYVYYCKTNEEWIFTEILPEEQPTNAKACTRGIASFPSVSSHPMFVRNWRFWKTDMWETSSGLKGLHLLCRHAPSLTCPVTEVVQRAPLNVAPAADLPNGPFILTNLSWNSRPTYSTPNNKTFIWYCGKFSEWIISTDVPVVGANGAVKSETCMRSLSSHRSSAATPYDHGHGGFSSFVDNEWQRSPAATSIECAADCPTLSLSNVPKRYLGLYETVGSFNRRRLFRQREAAHNLVFYSASCEHKLVVKDAGSGRGCWVIGADTAVSWTNPQNVYAVCLSDESDVQQTRAWVALASGNPVSPVFACEVHRRCAVLSVYRLPEAHAPLLGSYEEHSEAVGGYPTFRQLNALQPAFIFYCAKESKWMIGWTLDGDGCGGVVASQRTASTNPVQNVVWNQHFTNGRWVTELVGVQCFTDFDMDTVNVARLPGLRAYGAVKMVAKTPMHLGAVIKDCSFVGNVAGGDSAGSEAAGALLIHSGLTTPTQVHADLLRRLSISENEAVAVQPTTRAAGGLLINNAHHTLYHLGYVSEVTVTDNVGPTGGVHFAGAYVAATRLTLSKNKATGNGGGLRGSSWSNVTLVSSTCTKNSATVSGGCAKVDIGSSLLFHRSRLGECQAHHGSLFDGGTLVVSDSKLYSVADWAISACFLHMSSTEMLCNGGKPSSIVGGFGCVPDRVHTGPTPPQRKSAVETQSPSPAPSAGQGIATSVPGTAPVGRKESGEAAAAASDGDDAGWLQATTYTLEMALVVAVTSLWLWTRKEAPRINIGQRDHVVISDRESKNVRVL